MAQTTLITPKDAARTVGVTRRTLRAWAQAGVGPVPDRLGRYDRTAFTEWAQEMSTAASTMDRC